MTTLPKATTNDFAQQFSDLLQAMGTSLNEFSPRDEELKTQRFPNTTFSKTVLNKVLTLQYKFKEATARRLAARLECFLDATPREVLTAKLQDLRETEGIQISFLHLKENRVRISIRALMALYENSSAKAGRGEVVPLSSPAEDTVDVDITSLITQEEITDESLRQLAEESTVGFVSQFGKNTKARIAMPVNRQIAAPLQIWNNREL